jgi:P27 family predicted phage terminase small subunit
MDEAKKPKLSKEAQSLYRRVRAEWQIRDEIGLHLLRTACECCDEMRAAQAVIEAEGAIVKDRFGQARLHPATQRLKESRSHMLMALKALNLDLDSLEGK